MNYRFLSYALVASLLLLPASTIHSAPSPANLSLTPDWMAEGNQEFAGFGFSVNGAGDVNGDGYPDIVVGARGYENGQTDEGRAYAYYGSASGLGQEPAWISESNQAYSWYGMIVTGAGDVNGDGYADVIVSGVRYDHPETDEGAAFVFYGGPNGLSRAPNWMAESDQPGAIFGRYVNGAGDVNGDGYADVIIGAPRYSNDQQAEGRAYVYFGSRNGLSLTPNWIGEGNQPESEYGNSVSGAGDINGDGYDDIIVGAPNYSHGLQSEGRAFVYYGSPAGPSQTPDWMDESNQDHSNFGACVARAGDVNRDGYGDVIIAANHYSNAQYHQEGAAFVYYGTAAGLSTTSGWMFEGRQTHAHTGTACSPAGDVNGDGYADIAIGSYHFTNTLRSQGRVWVFFGSSTGLSPTANWINESDQQDSLYGIGVGAAGDVNLDGYDDLLVGAYDYRNGQRREGRAFEYNGGPGPMHPGTRQ